MYSSITTIQKEFELRWVLQVVLISGRLTNKAWSLAKKTVWRGVGWSENVSWCRTESMIKREWKTEGCSSHLRPSAKSTNADCSKYKLTLGFILYSTSLKTQSTFLFSLSHPVPMRKFVRNKVSGSLRGRR